MSEINQLLLKKINENEALIENWFENQFKNHAPLFYNSVDLRHSSFKIAPVDINCFPAGFNNLSDSSKKNAAKIIADFFANNYPNAKKILLLPENHTKNIKYLENIANLFEIISSDTSREIVIGSLIEDLDDKLNLEKIMLHKLIRNGDKIVTKSGFIPDLIISNNDFTNAPEEILKNILQPIIPPVSMGWHIRRKSKHFNIYNELAVEFGALIDIDPWLISTQHRHHDNIDFKEKKGVENVAKSVDELIANTSKKYVQYNLQNTPYCYIKSDNGTYGMAIMTASSGEEILKINKKDRNKMNMLKGHVQNTHVMIQEGIATTDLIKGAPAEPLIYLINGKVVGNLFRAHEKRDANISLNATGMSFYDIENLNDEDLSLGLEKNNITKIYSVIARLAALAAAKENISN